MEIVLNLTWRPGPVMRESHRSVKCSNVAQRMRARQTYKYAPRTPKDSRCNLARSHASGVAERRPGTAEDRPNGVEENAAGAADPDFIRAARAACSFLRRRVPTTMCLLLHVRAPADPEEPSLAPARAPGVLDQPVLLAGARLAVADQGHRVVHRGLQRVAVEHAALVAVPILGRHERDADRPVLQGA